MNKNILLEWTHDLNDNPTGSMLNCKYYWSYFSIENDNLGPDYYNQSYIYETNLRVFKKVCAIMSSQIKIIKSDKDDVFDNLTVRVKDFVFFKKLYKLLLAKSFRTRHKQDQIWAERIKKRDGKCLYCGSNEMLEAHHIMPFSENYGKRLDLDNGITLCKKCHNKKHLETK